MVLISQRRKVRKEFRKDLSVTLRLCEREILITDIIKKIPFHFEQNLTPDCTTYGFGYTFQFSQMTKSTQVPSWVLF